jgi:hypothetical protein
MSQCASTSGDAADVPLRTFTATYLLRVPRRAPSGHIQRVMVALDGASHDRAKQREQHASDVFDVREADGSVGCASIRNCRAEALR